MRSSSSGRTNWPERCSISFVPTAHPLSQHAREVAPDLSHVRGILEAVKARLTQHQDPRVIADGLYSRRAGRVQHDSHLAEQFAFSQDGDDASPILHLHRALPHETHAPAAGAHVPYTVAVVALDLPP